MSQINYFFKGSKYIRVTRGDTGPGSVDSGYPQTITNWEWPSGFGADGIDAALYSGSKCYFFKGSQYVRVTRDGNVNAGQQDFQTPHPISEWGWPAGFGADGIDAALWSGPFTYFFKGTQYIRVTRNGDSDVGKTDSGYPQPLSNWGFPQGFGTNGIKGALYSGSVCYFFDGPNYIRVNRGLEGAGYVDEGYPRKIADVWGWPTAFGGNNGIDAALYSGGPLVPQPTPITGNNNYFIQDSGNPLLGVNVTVNIDEVFVSTIHGFSFQLNAFSTPARQSVVDWQQYIVWDHQDGTVTSAAIQTWNKGAGTMLTNSGDFGVVTLPKATTIPQGYQFTWALTYDNDNNVTGSKFTVLDGKTGTVIGTPQTVTIAGATAPIFSYTFNIGCQVGGGPAAVITPGAAGTITYSSTNPVIAVASEPQTGVQTAENANILFGPMPTIAHNSITQGFCTTSSPPVGPGAGA